MLQLRRLERSALGGPWFVSASVVAQALGARPHPSAFIPFPLVPVHLSWGSLGCFRLGVLLEVLRLVTLAPPALRFSCR